MRVAIIGGARIPFARANGAYIDASNQDMLTAALKALVERHGLKGERLGEGAAGAGGKHTPRRGQAGGGGGKGGEPPPRGERGPAPGDQKNRARSRPLGFLPRGGE